LLLEGDSEPGKPEAVEVDDDVDARRPQPSKAKDRRARLPENLPVVETVLDPEPVKACPQAWRCIGEEVSEQLNYEPARFVRRRLLDANIFTAENSMRCQ
jgi:transposase